MSADGFAGVAAGVELFCAGARGWLLVLAGGAGGGGAGAGGGYFVLEGALGSGCCCDVWAISPQGNAADITRINQYLLQNDDLPNPWDSLPTYFPDLLAALQ